MPLAKDYVCYSVRVARSKPGMTSAAVDALQEAGLGCKVSAVSAERIARFVAKLLRVKLGKVYVKDADRGHSHIRQSYITLPHWLLHRDFSKAYIVYYIAHEVAHLHPDAYDNHGKSFKRVERRALKRFGLGIRYQRAYPYQLFARKDGRVLFTDARYAALRMMREESLRIKGTQALNRGGANIPSPMEAQQ